MAINIENLKSHVGNTADTYKYTFDWCCIWATTYGNSPEKFTSCTAFWNTFVNYRTKTAEIGSYILYDWNLSGDCDHIGIIIDIDDTYYTVIEGNTGNIDFRFSKVNIYKRRKDANFVKGFITFDTVTTDSYIGIHDFGENVRRLQELLEKCGYNVGYCGIDGDFGKDTENAVKTFQRENHIEIDGIVGHETAHKLIETYLHI